MRHAFVRLTCRILIACIAGLPLAAQADLIATEQAAASASAQGARALVASRMEALGVAPDLARDRIAALTDREVLQMSKDLETAPAGGGLFIGVALVVAFLIWRFNFSDQAKAEKAEADRAAKTQKK